MFFGEIAGMTTLQNAVGRNVNLFEAKFQGAVPVPKKFAPSWSVVLRSDTVEIGGHKVEVSICRPSVAGKDGLSEGMEYLLSTLDPSSVADQAKMSVTVDGKETVLTHGEDFWVNTVAKLRTTKAVSWF